MRPVARSTIAGLLLALIPASQPEAAGASSLWDSLSRLERPERERIREPFRFRRSYGRTGIRGLEYLQDRDGDRARIVGLVLTNEGSRRINPAGLGRSQAFREYRFLYPDRARENVHLIVTDDVAVSGRYSQDNMFREWHFFPRRLLPALELDRPANRARVILPTGESAEFDLSSMELVGGVLQEEPLDRTRDRHARSNPRVRYKGEYLAITVAQRGESARRARVWGRTKLARVYYPSRYAESCEISPQRLWDQSPKPGDTDPRLSMLHVRDETLFDLIERHCGWDLAGLRRPPTRLAAGQAPTPEPRPSPGVPPEAPAGRVRPGPDPGVRAGFEH